MANTEFRILDYNYAFQTNVDISATSEQTSFPATNLGEYIRAKSWRSNGFFVIDNTNNKIDFKETDGGAEITAILTNGNYTTTTLSAHIKEKMEVVSLNSRTYTVSYSALTGKWTITGQTYLSLLFSTGTNASTSIRNTIGFSASDYTGGITYISSFIAIHSYEAVTIDLKSAEPIDSFGLFFDPMDKINLSSSAIIKLQANATPSWASPDVNITLAIDEDRDVITYFFTTEQEYRYWRIYIEDPKNPDLYVELGTVFLGKATQLSKVPDNGFDFSQLDQSNSVENEYGQQYIDQYPIRKTITFNYSVLPYSDIATLDALFKRVGTHTPIMVSMDSLESQFDKDQFTIYGRLDKTYVQTHMVTNYYKTNLKVIETI